MPKAATTTVTKTATKAKAAITKPVAAAKPKSAKETKAGKEPKAKKEKDPNAPKRGRSAYIIFCQEMREEVKAEAESTKDIMRLLGERWKKLSEKEKAPYIAKQEKDKQRAEREKKAYDGKENRSEDSE